MLPHRGDLSNRVPPTVRTSCIGAPTASMPAEPTYAELMSDDDGTGKQRSYLTESSFALEGFWNAQSRRPDRQRFRRPEGTAIGRTLCART
jgi:hypothetical protein